MALIYEPTEYVSPDGETFRFTNVNRFILSETGYGMPGIKYITQKGPFQHGETYLGYRLEPRVIQMQFRNNGCSRANYWANRQLLVNMLRPNRQAVNNFAPGKLRKTFEDGEIRDIDVHIQDGPVFKARDTGSWDEWSFDETIRFIAPDPTFYDPTVNTQTAVYTTSNHLVFYNAVTGASFTDFTFRNAVHAPTVNGVVMETGVIETTLNCINAGTWITFPTITVTGPLNGVMIENTTTGELLRINYFVPTGQTLIASLPYGAKRVYISQTGENVIGTVSHDSDLSTFHLEPDPGAANGVNAIRVLGVGAVEGVTAIVISWYNRYIGI